VFDFDGTLVETAALKRRAFFALFPDDARYAAIVEAVLTDDPDGSRHLVIPRMVETMAAAGLSTADSTIGGRIAHYGAIVGRAVAQSPEVAGAGALLERCHAVATVHVASATPVEPLRTELQRRGWSRHLDGIHGYPARKGDVVASLMQEGGHPAAATLVVGDGISDAEAARVNGAVFHRIAPPADLSPVARLMGFGP
jgi:phosphoglycolate phosphatase-like HAD superfamily hydrolase